MPQPKPKKVVYLFGAGATHAELTNPEPTLIDEKLGLLIKNVLISRFVKFYLALLDEIKKNLKLLSSYKRPTNPTILEDFQKYISQASVEPYAIRRRNQFLETAFEHYLNPKTKNKIIGGD